MRALICAALAIAIQLTSHGALAQITRTGNYTGFQNSVLGNLASGFDQYRLIIYIVIGIASLGYMGKMVVDSQQFRLQQLYVPIGALTGTGAVDLLINAVAPTAAQL